MENNIIIVINLLKCNDHIIIAITLKVYFSFRHLLVILTCTQVLATTQDSFEVALISMYILNKQQKNNKTFSSTEMVQNSTFDPRLNYCGIFRQIVQADDSSEQFRFYEAVFRMSSGNCETETHYVLIPSFVSYLNIPSPGHES